MNLDDLHRRYNNDSVFHAAVDMMQALIMSAELTPSEVRDAALFANYIVEMRMPRVIRLDERGPVDWQAALDTRRGTRG